MVKQNLSLL